MILAITRIILFTLATFLAAFSAFGQQKTYRVTFIAELVKDGVSVEKGLEWRIFGPRIGEDGHLPLLATAEGGSKTINMSAGEYLVHAAYGHASAIRRIEITAESHEEYFILNAGGLELTAVAGIDTPISPDLLRFDVYEQKTDARGHRKLIARKMLPNIIVPFQAGTYHVVSIYGNLNAKIRADIRVRAGKVTKAQLKHKAARITLRLVRVKGGDALANTQWSILNESGELIAESTSAFPQLVLSEGVYTAIAKNNERIYSQDFNVTAGRNEDAEILVGG